VSSIGASEYGPARWLGAYSTNDCRHALQTGNAGKRAHARRIGLMTGIGLRGPYKFGLQMTKFSLYDQGHLFVAAIRILAHQRKTAPVLADVCRMLGLTEEAAGLICRRLASAGVIETVTAAYDGRLVILDHLKLEQLPKTDQQPALQDEIEQFCSRREQLKDKVEAMRAQQKEKRKDLFADIENKLRKQLNQR